MAELGGSQISALLESVPGIAKVLRSPVADALVSMIRAGAGLGDFRLSDVDELMQYSVRRGLISADEAERLTEEVRGAGRSSRSPTAKKPRTSAGRSQAKSARPAKASGTSARPKAAAKKKPVAKSSAAPAKRKAVKRR